MGVKKIVLAVLVLVVLVGGGYWVYSNQSVGSTRKVTVSPKWLNQAQFAGMFVAKERGIYRRHGLDVKFKEFDFESNQIEDLTSGKTDFALISAEELMVLTHDKVPIRAVAAIYQISPYVIVSLADSGISTPADFAGKTLGNKGGKLEEDLFYELLLSSVGLSEGDTTIKNLGFEKKEVDDLLDGNADTVDLYRTDQLYFFDHEGVAVNVIYPEQYGVSTYNDILVAKIDLIESDPELVRSFVVATVEGWERAIEDPESAVDDTLKYVTDKNYKDRDYEKFILEQSIPLIKPNSNTQIGSMGFAVWNKLHNQMEQEGFISEGLHISEIFTTEFLP